MPQFKLTVNDMRGIIGFMYVPVLHLESIPETGDVHVFNAASLRLNLPQLPVRFYRHGWQSWSLTTWLDPTEPPVPVRAAEFRMKDEDPGYSLHKKHIGAWVGAVEIGEDDILLLGSLGLSGRVEVEGSSIQGFFEDGHEGRWMVTRGPEDQVFSSYLSAIETSFGKGRVPAAPRVWCSWYSLHGWINEYLIQKALEDFGDMPFDVFQLDDGWQTAHGDWEANSKFPSGMKSLADRIRSTGRTPGLWLAPFMVATDSELARAHPDWLLRDEEGKPVGAGITWSGNPVALDSSHPGVLEWLDRLIRKIRSWGYGYLKLDFLYLGGSIGKRYRVIPREVAYRNAMRIIREAAGDSYILACGAPILPSIGLCDGIRIGPDVAPYWLNKPLSVWLNNPNEPSTQNAIRTSVHRLWLRPVVNVDPDVVYFRSRHNALQAQASQLLRDLGLIAGFKATSDLPHWMNTSENEMLRGYLDAGPAVRKERRYAYQIDGRQVDFSSAIPIEYTKNHPPIWLARNLGMLYVVWHQALPAIREGLIPRFPKQKS
jgi:alpha-galactosidase